MLQQHHKKVANYWRNFCCNFVERKWQESAQAYSESVRTCQERTTWEHWSSLASSSASDIGRRCGKWSSRKVKLKDRSRSAKTVCKILYYGDQRGASSECSIYIRPGSNEKKKKIFCILLQYILKIITSLLAMRFSAYPLNSWCICSFFRITRTWRISSCEPPARVLLAWRLYCISSC